MSESQRTDAYISWFMCEPEESAPCSSAAGDTGAPEEGTGRSQPRSVINRAYYPTSRSRRGRTGEDKGSKRSTIPLELSGADNCSSKRLLSLNGLVLKHATGVLPLPLPPSLRLSRALRAVQVILSSLPFSSQPCMNVNTLKEGMRGTSQSEGRDETKRAEVVGLWVGVPQVFYRRAHIVLLPTG
ncbi:hypothetical protein F7725_016693, partial [Dissostichus mawsoni]